MNEFLMMNIFFVISAIGFVILFVLLAVALFYIIKLIKTLDSIAQTVDEEATALKGDLDQARAGLKNGGLGLLSLFGFAGKTSARLIKKRRSTK